MCNSPESLASGHRRARDGHPALFGDPSGIGTPRPLATHKHTLSGRDEDGLPTAEKRADAFEFAISGGGMRYEPRGDCARPGLTASGRGAGERGIRGRAYGGIPNSERAQRVVSQNSLDLA